MIFAGKSSYFASIAKALDKNILQFFIVSIIFSDSELLGTHSFACLFIIVLGLKRQWHFAHGTYLSSGNFPFYTTLRLNFFLLHSFNIHWVFAFSYQPLKFSIPLFCFHFPDVLNKWFRLVFSHQISWNSVMPIFAKATAIQFLSILEGRSIRRW